MSKPDSVDMSVLGVHPAPGGPSFDFGLGDLPTEGDPPGTDGARRTRERSEWGGTLRAIVADHTPAVGLRFRAWAERHAELIAQFTTPQAFALYVEVATLRDAMADEHRPEEQREYDWAQLHMSGLQPLIEAEVQAQREEIASGVREAFRERLQALHAQGLLSDEVLQLMLAGGGSDG